MYAPRGLATVALLKTRLDEGNDHIALYEPFICDALAHVDSNNLLAQDVKTALQHRSGIVLLNRTRFSWTGR